MAIADIEKRGSMTEKKETWEAWAVENYAIPAEQLAALAMPEEELEALAWTSKQLAEAFNLELAEEESEAGND